MARFYMWDLYFKHFDGKFSEALESYHQGLPYAHKLTGERYKRYLLNAGSIHLAEGKFKEALTIYREVRQTFIRIPSPSDSGLFELYGRTLLGEAEASLDLVLYNDQPGVDLEHVIEQLSRAASIFTLTESHARGAVANSALGLAHTLSRRPREGQLFLGLAFSLAERHLLHREEILTLYRRALASFLEKEYDDALSDVDQALTLGQRYDIGEFETRLRYLKGKVYEEARQRAQALEAYEVAFNVARESSYGRDKHLFQLASASAFRVNKTLPSAPPYLTYLSGLLGLLLALSLLAYLAGIVPRRRRTKTLPSREDAFSSQAPPSPSRFLPTPSSLQPALSPTIARSIAYIWLLCFHLEHWRDAIHRLDPTLLDKLTAADPASQQEHKPLLLAVYALEQELGTGDKDELKTPYRSIKIRLSRFFHEQGWLEIPRGVYGWRLFFLERGWETDPPLWLRQQLP
ncbi:MAG: tetratricopeptide repeat protein [Bacteroidetes bacterium]|nr:tetratricopeptide repeat protein [Bacteroidota bacterium]